MWPFKRKPKDGGLGISFNDLSAEEKQEVSHLFDSFVTPDGRHIGREGHSMAVRKGLIALGLWNYAERKALGSEYESHMGNREVQVGRAIDAIKKAYKVYPLPIYLYDLGRYLEMAGRVIAADNAYKAFLEELEDYVPAENDHLFMNNRSVEEAVEDAKVKLDT